MIGMPAQWPVSEFNEYLERLMDAADIKDRAELSRLAGLNQTQLSAWRKGISQPSWGSLKKIAPVLRVPARNLAYMAALADEETLQGPVDITVIPAEIQELIDLYHDGRVTDDEREMLRRHVAVLVAGVRSRFAATKPRRVRKSA